MKHKAVLKTKSRDAGSVAKALETDNLEMRDLKITSSSVKEYVLTEVESNSLGSLLNTLDDVLHCQMLAENVIK